MFQQQQQQQQQEQQQQQQQQQLLQQQQQQQQQQQEQQQQALVQDVNQTVVASGFEAEGEVGQVENVMDSGVTNIPKEEQIALGTDEDHEGLWWDRGEGQRHDSH